MANRKISDLTALTATAVGDLLPIVDISEALAADKNKRITLGTLLGGAPLGSAAAPTFAFSGYPSTGIYSPGADQLAIATGGTGRVFVDGSGNVGVGTTPTTKLDVVGNGNSELRLRAASDPSLIFSETTANKNWKIKPSAGDLYFQYSATAYNSGYSSLATLTSSGRLGINTTSPGAPLSVNGNAIIGPESGTRLAVNLTENDKVELQVIDSTSTARALALTIGTTEAACIDSSGRLLVGTSSARGLFFNGGSAALTQIEGNSTATASLSITRNDATADGNALILAKARSTNYAIVQYVNGTTSDDRIGRISFQGADGTDMVPGAEINAFVDGTPGANDMPGRLVFSTTADGAASPTEAMRITSAQNIRIGTTGDGSGSTTGRIRLTGNTGGINSIYTEQSVSGGYNFVSSTISNGGIYYHANFLEGGTQRGSITSNGTATSYTTSSDYRLKENVVAITDGIPRLLQLKPSQFNFITEPGKTVDGFLAHEAQAVVPECVTGDKDAVDDDGNPVYQGIDQSKMVPLLTAALQEAIARIETLETRLSTLEGA